MEHLLASAKRDMISQAVAKNIENDAAAWLSDMAVPSLPTIAFDVPINIRHRDGKGNWRCLGVTTTNTGTRAWTTIGTYELPCADKDETLSGGGTSSRRSSFTLSAGGLIRLAANPTQCLSMRFAKTAGSERVMLYVYDLKIAGCDQAERLFFDPADGTLRYLVQGQQAPSVNGLFCVTNMGPNLAIASLCGGNEVKALDTKWVLVGAGGQTPTSATKGIRRIAGKAVAAPSNDAVTNLAPLRLSR